MKYLFGPLIFILLISCSSKDDIYLYGQWHLIPKDNTTSQDEAQKLPQFDSQVRLYKEIAKKVESGEINTIFAEGCEGEITSDFSSNFNGWDLNLLEKAKNEVHFDEILAPVQMKLKVKFPDLKVLCGDNLDLIRENQLSFSEIQGHLGFLSALIKNYENDLTKYLLYKKNYLEVIKKETFPIHPILYAKEEVKKNIDIFLEKIKKRNDSFLMNLKKLNRKEAKIAIIIGQVHLKDLEKKLEKNYSVIKTPLKTKDLTEDKVIKKLQKSLAEIKLPNFVKYSQMPSGFKIDSFPIENKIKEEELLNSKDKNEILELEHYYQMPFHFLTSDYDKDGIRDFTVSSGNDFLVIASEDRDWDNDGVDNLNDVTLDGKVISKTTPLVISNQYQLNNQSEKDLKKWFEDRKIGLLTDSGSSLELLSLYLFKTVYEIYKVIPDVKFVRSLSKNSDGRNVFFSYVKHSKALEIYTQDLIKYTNRLKENRFKDVSLEIFIKEVVTPIILQSLFHEMAHSLTIFNETDFFNYGWSFQKESLESRYLTKHRDPVKVLSSIYINLKYKTKTFSEWKKEYSHNFPPLSLEKYNSLLLKIEAPSIYALTSMDEWESEIAAACGLKLLFPSLRKNNEGKRFELLIDFNPSAIPKDICKKVPLGT